MIKLKQLENTYKNGEDEFNIFRVIESDVDEIKVYDILHDYIEGRDLIYI